MNNKIKNLILISIDTLRTDVVDDYCNLNTRHSKEFTLRNIFKKGAFYNNCITSAPYTSTAHASALTGKWPTEHGLIEFIGNKIESETLFEILNKSGYDTLFQTDFPFLLGKNLGFVSDNDYFVEGDDEKSIEWIKKRKKPFSAFFHFSNIHAPYGFVDLKHDGDNFRNKVKELLNEYMLEADKKAIPTAHYEVSKFSEDEMILRQNYFKVLNFLHERGEYDRILKLYNEGMEYFEKNRFKQLIDNFKKLDLLKNTLIVIFGDHGEAWDVDNMGHMKGNYQNGLIDDIIKVPLVFYGPGIKKEIISRQVRTIDIVPTILSYLGVKNNNVFDGRDLNHLSNEEELIAYSQLWKSEKEKMGQYLSELNSKNSIKKTNFKSFLAQAVVRYKNKKITQNFSDNDKLIKTSYVNIRKQKEIPKKGEQYKKLLSELNEYNKKSRKKVSESKDAQKNNDKEIISQLRSLGYTV